MSTLEGPGPFTVSRAERGEGVHACGGDLTRTPPLPPHTPPPPPPLLARQVFAPENRAFDALGRNILDYVLNPHNIKTLDAVLTNHVVAGRVLSNQLTDGQVIPTLDTPQTVTAHIAGGVVSINNARVITADVLASNGVVQ